MRPRTRKSLTIWLTGLPGAGTSTIARRGLHGKALAGALDHFTGVSDPYEPPLMPELVVERDRETPQQNAMEISIRMQSPGYLEATRIEEPTPAERLAPIQGASEA